MPAAFRRPSTTWPDSAIPGSVSSVFPEARELAMTASKVGKLRSRSLAYPPRAWSGGLKMA